MRAASFYGSANFNPRSREGSDVMTQEDMDALIISIRAPARGATI